MEAIWSQGVYLHPRPRAIEISLTALRLAYPRFRPSLTAFLAKRPLTLFQVTRNLWFAFEFLIPLVIPFSASNNHPELLASPLSCNFVIPPKYVHVSFLAPKTFLF